MVCKYRQTAQLNIELRLRRSNSNGSAVICLFLSIFLFPPSQQTSHTHKISPFWPCQTLQELLNSCLLFWGFCCDVAWLWCWQCSECQECYQIPRLSNQRCKLFSPSLNGVAVFFGISNNLALLLGANPTRHFECKQTNLSGCWSFCCCHGSVKQNWVGIFYLYILFCFPCHVMWVSSFNSYHIFCSMDEALCSYIQKDRPFLGICLGLQLLFESSEENGPGQLSTPL